MCSDYIINNCSLQDNENEIFFIKFLHAVFHKSMSDLVKSQLECALIHVTTLTIRLYLLEIDRIKCNDALGNVAFPHFSPCFIADNLFV